MRWFAIILLAALPAHADIVKVNAPKPAAFDFRSGADRAAEAKYKTAKAFERLGNWKRARDSYDELLKESPAFAQASDAKQRLAELTKAHPE